MWKFIILLMMMFVPLYVFAEVDPGESMGWIERILEYLRGKDTLLAAILVFVIEFIMRRKKTEKPMSLLGMASNAMDKIAPQNSKSKK